MFYWVLVTVEHSQTSMQMSFMTKSSLASLSSKQLTEALKKT